MHNLGMNDMLQHSFLRIFSEKSVGYIHLLRNVWKTQDFITGSREIIMDVTHFQHMYTEEVFLM